MRVDAQLAHTAPSAHPLHCGWLQAGHGAGKAAGADASSCLHAPGPSPAAAPPGLGPTQHCCAGIIWARYFRVRPNHLHLSAGPPCCAGAQHASSARHVGCVHSTLDPPADAHALPVQDTMGKWYLVHIAMCARDPPCLHAAQGEAACSCERVPAEQHHPDRRTHGHQTLCAWPVPRVTPASCPLAQLSDARPAEGGLLRAARSLACCWRWRPGSWRWPTSARSTTA